MVKVGSGEWTRMLCGSRWHGDPFEACRCEQIRTAFTEGGLAFESLAIEAAGDSSRRYQAEITELRTELAELRALNERTSKELVAQEARVARIDALWPDHCYSCERPCKYHGQSKLNGAQRCKQCLMIERLQRDAALRAKIERGFSL